MPITPYYRAAMDSGSWDRAEVIIKNLGQKYGARYLSFEPEPRLTDEDFNDVNHLNSRGAKRFSDILDAALGPPQPHEHADELSPTSAAQTEIGSAQ
jgi:hypothetical protein